MRNEKSQDVRGSEDDEKLSIWFTRGTKKLIEIIRDSELDSTTTIGKETKKAITALMVQLESEKKYKLYNPNNKILKFENGKEYLIFNDPEFQNALNKYKNDPNSIGGLLYVVEVRGVYYLGLTERTLKIRIFHYYIFDEIVIFGIEIFGLGGEGFELPEDHRDDKTFPGHLAPSQVSSYKVVHFLVSYQARPPSHLRKCF